METVLYKRHPIYTHLFCGDNGDIWSLKRSKFIKGSKDKDGYLMVCLWFGGKCIGRRKHRLTIEAFRGLSELTVDHLNYIKDDNRLLNLEYVSRELNVIRSFSNPAPSKRTINGERAGGAKLKESQVLEIIAMGRLKKYRIMELTKYYSVSYATIFNITRNKSWKYLERDVPNF